jgi:hypothetical protein
MRFTLSIVPLAALLALTACGSSILEPFSSAGGSSTTRPAGPADDGDEPLTPSAESVFTVGIITEAPARLGTATFLIEQHPDRPFGGGSNPLADGDKYYVRVTSQTQIRRRSASGESQPATPDDIRAGLRAEVWFVGPIQESWPMQGTAGRIMLFDP